MKPRFSIRAALVTLLLHLVASVLAYAASGALLPPGHQSSVWHSILRILLAPSALVGWLVSAAGYPSLWLSAYGYLLMLFFSAACWACVIGFIWGFVRPSSRRTI